MADDTETTATAEAEATTSTETVPPPSVEPTPAETETPAAETQTETATEDSETRPEDPEAAKEWDKDRQKRAQSAANERKRLDAEEKRKQQEELAELRKRQLEQDERMKQLLEVLAAKAEDPTKTQAQRKEAKDELEEAEELEAQAVKAEQGDDENPADFTKAEQLRRLAFNKMLTAAKKDREARKRLEEQADEERKAIAAEEAQWSGFRKANPEISVAEAKTLRDECWRAAGEEGFDGSGQSIRMRQLMQPKLEALKKSKKSPTNATTTAPAPTGKAPGQVRTAPVNSGARMESVQQKDVNKSFVEGLLKNVRL